MTVCAGVNSHSLCTSSANQEVLLLQHSPSFLVVELVFPVAMPSSKKKAEPLPATVLVCLSSYGHADHHTWVC